MTNWSTKKLGQVIRKITKKRSGNNNNIRIPAINRDNSLIRRLIVIVIGGFDGVLDRESQLFLRLLCKLLDKSFDEYSTARNYLTEELKTKDKLAYRFSVINHLENCINALNRAIKIFNSLVDEIMVDKKRLVREYNILQFVSKETTKKIAKYKVSGVRNRVEHIDEDIYKNEFRSRLFLDVDDKYEKLCINDNCVSLSDLALAIEHYHNFVLEIINNLPNRIGDGVYYYDKK